MPLRQAAEEDTQRVCESLQPIFSAEAANRQQPKNTENGHQSAAEVGPLPEASQPLVIAAPREMDNDGNAEFAFSALNRHRRQRNCLRQQRPTVAEGSLQEAHQPLWSASHLILHENRIHFESSLLPSL